MQSDIHIQWTDIEYEYLYLDKEITIDKIMAKTRRKRVLSISVDKIEILSASGEWQTTTAYTVNLETGVVTFSTAPGVSPVEGADNVRIKFSKPIIENENKIRQCTIFTFFGNFKVRLKNFHLTNDFDKLERKKSV